MINSPTGWSAVQIDSPKILNYLLLVLSLLAGSAIGNLSARAVDLSLVGESQFSAVKEAESIPVLQLQESDLHVVLRRNLFDSTAPAIEQSRNFQIPIERQEKVVKPARIRKKLILVGTVVAGEKSLALIRAGAKVEVFHLGEELLPEVVVTQIDRKMVILIDHGSRRELFLKTDNRTGKCVVTPSKVVTKRGVAAMGDNSWRISSAVVANARANLNSLLRTARMIPQIKNGKTTGFKLVELQRGSLLGQMGLKVGDLVVEINRVKLNSPEKALQIFQQVRDANNISLGLVRNGKLQTFEYHLE